MRIRYRGLVPALILAACLAAVALTTNETPGAGRVAVAADPPPLPPPTDAPPGTAPPPKVHAGEPPAAPRPAGAPAAPGAPTTSSLSMTQPEMESAFEAFYKGDLDVDRPLTVHNLTIKRDTMEMTLADGVVCLMKPVAGSATGAYFVGSGHMRVTLPNPIDRKLLKDSYGRPEFGEDFSAAVLRFDDGADREILAAGKPGGTAPADARADWANRLRIESNSDDTAVDFLENRMNQAPEATFFGADILARDGKDWFNVVHDGRTRIEDWIGHEHSMGTAGKRWFETLTSFHKPQDYDAKGNYDVMPAADSKEQAALRHVKMSVDIPNTKSVIIDAELTVEALRDGLRAVRFDLLNNLGGASWQDTGRPVQVIGVTDESGKPIPYLHRWHRLLVALPAPLTKGEKTVVRVRANEDTIIELTSKSYWIFTDRPWFPKIGGENTRYTFDWIVRTAAPLKAAGSGSLVREWTEEKMNCSEWKCDVPVSLPSFIFGEFDRTDDAYQRDKGEGQVALHLFTIRGGAEHFKGSQQNILSNIETGIKTYETILGPMPFPQLDIAEMAHMLGFGQSPPGILLIPGALGEAGGGGLADQLIFHELAHQWWGHHVGLVGPEDDWISESWAEYSSGLITDAIDPKKFKKMLETWRREAFKADPYGTIATAYRSNTIEHGDERTQLLYDKGPLVVHMLRTWMGWDKFSKYTSALQSKYAFTNINTDTLAREASTVMGYDMFPFFDQWVRDKGIPKVHWSWRVAPDGQGKQIVTITTRQEDEASFKILMVPITLDFGKGTPTVVPKPILKARAEIQLRVPEAPKDVRLDDDETQLATFIAEKPGSTN